MEHQLAGPERMPAGQRALMRLIVIHRQYGQVINAVFTSMGRAAGRAETRTRYCCLLSSLLKGRTGTRRFYGFDVERRRIPGGASMGRVRH
ncbi:hypothetical protein EVAR_61119_1 [Eumeta japonica]|uniref:Uncharacterized protein n=1 Tax=Eumeta variegata TaxID=151549 RepID=A0A4C1ZF46_EUMVA|nr:hypothetical protein EVAR_61119_1 [Eumeta japonica]